MPAILDKLKVSKSDGMGGIGADQGQIAESINMKGDDESVPDHVTGTREKGPPGRAPNSAGGPSFGRTSFIPRHESELLNKLDPRIGYDDDKVREDAVEKYEAKYGKPGEIPDPQLRGDDMSGIGADQSALQQ